MYICLHDSARSHYCPLTLPQMGMGAPAAVILVCSVRQWGIVYCIIVKVAIPNIIIGLHCVTGRQPWFISYICVVVSVNVGLLVSLIRAVACCSTGS